MQITAAEVKKLRETTGAGMMDCKKALVECKGEFDDAVKFLREKGLAAAKKKSGRVASEGLVQVLVDDNHQKASAIEINSETDFVAKNDQFIDLVGTLLKDVHGKEMEKVEDYLASTQTGGSQTIKEVLDNAISTIGENMNLRRFATWKVEPNEYIAKYVHGNGRIGVLVHLNTDGSDLTNNEAFCELATDMCMHVAAAKPLYLKPDEVPTETLDEEKAIFRTQLLNQGKPEEMLDKIIMGKINKYYKEICLLNQAFVKEDKKSIQQVLDQAKKDLGMTVSIRRFLRYELGEGIEKKEDNLADEVASLTK